MYLQSKGNLQSLSILPIVGTLVTAVATAAAPSINDWIKKQLGLPTSSEEQAKATAQAYEVQKELAKMKMEQEAQMQKIMIIGGLAIGGILLYTALSKRRKK